MGLSDDLTYLAASAEEAGGFKNLPIAQYGQVGVQTPGDQGSYKQVKITSVNRYDDATIKKYNEIKDLSDKKLKDLRLEEWIGAACEFVGIIGLIVPLAL